MPLIGIAIGVIIAPLDLLPLWLSPQPNTIEKALEEGINADIDGILLYVETSDKPPSIYSAGVNNKMAGSSLQADTLFKIASISKMFMAVSIVKLVDNQSLSLDDTLATLLPQRSQIINNADSITLSMLVQHTSGIPDFVNQQGYKVETNNNFRTKTEYVLVKENQKVTKITADVFKCRKST